jgi:hypothetical protein
MARIDARALSRISSNSASGSDSATLPAHAEQKPIALHNDIQIDGTVNTKIIDCPGVDAARTGFEGVDDFACLDFGAPVS